MVLSGAGIAAPTTVMRPTRPLTPASAGQLPPYAPQEPYYEYEEPMRRRPIWPWLLALGLVLSAAVAGWYVWTQIQDQLNASKPVAVPPVLNLKQANAVAQIEGVGLTAKVQFKAYQNVSKGVVAAQDPSAGTKTSKGNEVVITVSNGKPKTTVPDVKGEDIADAIAQLTQKHLKYKVVEINSSADPNTVTATAPGGGAVVPWNTVVRVNVSKGPRPVLVPTGLVGQPYANVESALQGAGFAVKRKDVESTEPKDTVVATDPAPGTGAAPSSTVLVSVSKGPKTTEVPDVSSQDEPSATSTLESSGFKVVSQDVETTDPLQDGIVISQDPAGGTQAKPGSKVTIQVGRLVGGLGGDTTTTPTTPTPTG